MPDAEYVPLAIKRLTLEARGGWDTIVEREGIDLTALAEALGLAFASGDMPRNSAQWKAIFDEARRIRRERAGRLR